MSKRERILTTAKALFIEKGFRGTTIAMIAESAGIAKGSVYSYFSSKLEIVKALILQTDEKNQQLVEQLLDKNDIKGRAVVEAYLMQEFQEILNERAFIQMFLNEDMVVMDSELMSVVQETRINYHQSQQKILVRAFGDDISDWLYDLVTIVGGLLNEYAVYLTLDDADFSIKRCANMVAFLVENAAQSLAKSELTPLLTKENFPLTKGGNAEQQEQKKALQIIVNIKTEAQSMSPEQGKLVLETLSLIEAELAQPKLNLTLVRALIANLRPYSELSAYRRRLADALDVELI